MNTRTAVATLTEEEARVAEGQYNDQLLATAELERLIGTYETYGTFNVVRPDFSEKANRNPTFTERKAA